MPPCRARRWRAGRAPRRVARRGATAGRRAAAHQSDDGAAPRARRSTRRARGLGWNTSGVALKISTRITAGASLKPDSASSRPGDATGQGHDAHDREHCGGVCRGHDRAEQQRQLPIAARAASGRPAAVTIVLMPTPRVARTACGRQTCLDVGEPRRQPAFDEDDGQSHGAEVARQLDVVEFKSRGRPHRGVRRCRGTAGGSAVRPGWVTRVATMLASSTRPAISTR